MFLTSKHLTLRPEMIIAKFLFLFIILCIAKGIPLAGYVKRVANGKCDNFFSLLVISRNDMCIDVLRNDTEFFLVQSQQMNKLKSKITIFIDNLTPKNDHVFDDLTAMDCIERYREEYMTTLNTDTRYDNINFRYVNSTALFYEYQVPRKAIIAMDEWAHGIIDARVEAGRISDIIRICLAHKFSYTYIDLDIIFNSPINEHYLTPFISVRQIAAPMSSKIEYSVEFTNTAFCLPKQTLQNILKYQIFLIYFHFKVEFETSTKEVVKKRLNNQSFTHLDSLFEGEDVELITTVKSIVTSKFKTSGGASTLVALRQQELGADALFKVICNTKDSIRLVSQNIPSEFSIKKLIHQINSQGHLLTHLTCSSSKLRLHHTSNYKIQFTDDKMDNKTKKQKKTPTYLQYVTKLVDLFPTTSNKSSLDHLNKLKSIQMMAKVTGESKSRGFLTVINENLLNFKSSNSTRTNKKCTGLEQSLLDNIFSFTTSDLIKNFYRYYSIKMTSVKIIIFVDKVLHCKEKIMMIINTISTGIVGNFELIEYDAADVLHDCVKKATSLYGRMVKLPPPSSMISACLSAQYQMTYLSLQTFIVSAEEISSFLSPFITMNTLIRTKSAYLRKRNDPMADRLHAHSSVSWHSYFLPSSIIYSGVYYHMQMLQNHEEISYHRKLNSKGIIPPKGNLKEKEKKRRRVYKQKAQSSIDNKDSPFFFDDLRKCLFNSQMLFRIYTHNNLGISNLKEIANEISYYNHHLITIPLKSALQMIPSPSETEVIKRNTAKAIDYISKPRLQQQPKNSMYKTREVKSGNKEKNSIKIYDNNINGPISIESTANNNKNFYWSISEITEEILSYTNIPPVDIDALIDKI